MKYLLDDRYKKIHSVIVTVNSISHVCRRGQSKELFPYLTQLQSHLEGLDVLKSIPFHQDQIQMVSSIEDSIRLFLHLPENLLEEGEHLVEQCKKLLETIDPFTFSFDDSVGIRRSQVVEFTKELQMYLKANLLQLQGLASSLVDEKSAIEDIMFDLKRISQEKFKQKEKKMLEILEEAFKEYEKDGSLEVVQSFYMAAIELESLFQL